MTSEQKSAKKRILEHFEITDDGVTFCPYLKCSGKKDPHAYFSKELWLEMCKQFIKHYES